MAKKKSTKKVEESEAEKPHLKGQPPAADDSGTPAATTVAEDEEEMELLQVELGDMVKMKQVLDEAVIAAVTEVLEEDTRWDNFKLGLMSASCLFAMIAQFAPLPFPESRPVLGICGSLYFILSGFLQIVTTYIDQDAILWTTKNSPYKGQQCAVCVRSNFPRFSEFYTVSLEYVVKEDDNTKKNLPNPPKASQTWSVGQFFDKEGYFYEAGIMEETKKLLQAFQAGKFDKENKVKKA